MVYIITLLKSERGTAVFQALGYKPKSRGFEILLSEWHLSNYLILSVAQGPVVYSTSNRNEYQGQK
jgi:hypothetical protein